MDLSIDELSVLEAFRPRLRYDGSEMRLSRIPVEPAERRIAEQLAKVRLLDRRRQSRKGFPPLFVITDAGVAALPADAPIRTRVPDILPGHTAPPRGS